MPDVSSAFEAALNRSEREGLKGAPRRYGEGSNLASGIQIGLGSPATF